MPLFVGRFVNVNVHKVWIFLKRLEVTSFRTSAVQFLSQQFLTDTVQQTVQIYIVPNVACELEVLLGSEMCYVLRAAENSAVFKWDLTEASETADQWLGSREFHSCRNGLLLFWHAPLGVCSRKGA